MILNRSLISMFSLTAVLATVGSASATVVYRSNINVLIPTTATGVYVDLDGNFATSTSASAGWDINISGTGTSLSFAAPLLRSDFLRAAGATTGSAGNLPANTSVGASGSYGAGVVDFGSGAGQWTTNGANLFGFRFNIGSATHYGWGRIDISNNGAVRTLRELSYCSIAGVAMPVGAIPAPGALALLGLAGLTSRRRRC